MKITKNLIFALKHASSILKNQEKEKEPIGDALAAPCLQNHGINQIRK